MATPDQARRGSLALIGAGMLLLALAMAVSAQDGRRWKPLAADGVHDPKGDAIKELKAPASVLQKLPPSSSPDLVDWAEAQRKGLVKPRSGVDPKAGTDATLHDSEIILNPNGSMKPVPFRHREHTQLLDCTNCHEDLFKMEEGVNNINKLSIQDGEQCGVCHRSVAFPLTQCERCHSGSWSVKPPAGAKPAAGAKR